VSRDSATNRALRSGQQFSKRNKLFQRHRLGAGLSGNAELIKRLDDLLGGPLLLEKLGHHFSAFAESEFYKALKNANELCGEERFSTTA
jgi:hypothetical protein